MDNNHDCNVCGKLHANNLQQIGFIVSLFFLTAILFIFLAITVSMFIRLVAIFS